MFTWLLRHFRSALPIPIPLLAVAVASGLAVGALYLGESVDLATAVGIAVCISVSVGSWLGLRLYLVTARFFISWIDAIGNRVASLESGLMPAGLADRDKNYAKPRRSLALHIVIISAYANPLCFGMVTTGAIYTVLSTQLGYHFLAPRLMATLFSLCILLIAIAIPSLYLWRLQRQVATLEQLLSRIDSVPPVVQRVQVMNRNISRTARIVRRLTGISQTATEQATA